MDELREKIAQEIKLMQIGLTCSYFQNKPSTKEQAEELMLIEATKTANFILALLKEAGWKSPKEIELMFNPDYLDFQKGVEVTKELFKDFVRLADNQELPPVVNELAFEETASTSYGWYLQGQRDMLKAGFRRVVL